jgi:hypothetical protein
LGRKPLNKWHMTIYQYICLNAWMTFMRSCLWAFVFAFGGWRFLSLLLERLKVFAFREVEGFYFCFLMLKVFVVSFECWRLLFLLFDVKCYCFFSWMFKVLTFVFRCSKFLFLLLDIEGFSFYYWMLKVLFILLGVEGFYFYF